MTSIYHVISDAQLTQSQEELLETIENVPFPFGGISKLTLRLVVLVRQLSTFRNDNAIIHVKGRPVLKWGGRRDTSHVRVAIGLSLIRFH